MTHLEEVLKHLQENKNITALTGIKEYGIIRLTDVIYDLRKLGYNIKSTKIYKKNKYNKTIYYMEYSLDDKEMDN